MKPQDPKQTPIKMVPHPSEVKNYTVFLTGEGRLTFKGRYLPERQRENWHYYIGDEGIIYHFRKEHMIAVIEEAIK